MIFSYFYDVVCCTYCFLEGTERESSNFFSLQASSFLGGVARSHARVARERRREFERSTRSRVISRLTRNRELARAQGNFLRFKVARYSFSGSIPPKFEGKLRRHKQRFGKINTTVVLDKDENLLWWGLQWHRSCHSNEMTPLPILLAAVFLGTGNCSSKIVYWSFYLR